MNSNPSCSEGASLAQGIDTHVQLATWNWSSPPHEEMCWSEALFGPSGFGHDNAQAALRPHALRERSSEPGRNVVQVGLEQVAVDRQAEGCGAVAEDALDGLGRGS